MSEGVQRLADLISQRMNDMLSPEDLSSILDDANGLKLEDSQEIQAQLGGRDSVRAKRNK